jgi:hypothetical protein
MACCKPVRGRGSPELRLRSGRARLTDPRLGEGLVPRRTGGATPAGPRSRPRHLLRGTGRNLALEL